MSRHTRILVVEDDKELSDIIRAVLELDGYTVTCTPDGLDALRELERQEFACVVLDLRMSTLDGEQLLDLMEFDYPTMVRKVVVVSGFQRRAEKLRERVGELLLKPVSGTALRDAVATVTAQPRRRRDSELVAS